MNSLTQTNRLSWAGRIISALPILFLLFDSAIKFTNIQPVVDSFTQLGYLPSIAVAIGLLELACIVVYVVPRTSIFGAILLTGYLGGAIATHVRVGNPLFSHVLFPIYVAAPLWGGLLLRDERLRALLFPRPSTAH
jgi:hypothetical protein